MNVRLFFCVLSVLITTSLFGQTNVAYQDDQVRFTVVTDGVIRLEWHPEGKFTDLGSFVASERDYPQVDYKVRKRGKNVEVTTSKMILTYKMNSGMLVADNLTIKAADGSDYKVPHYDLPEGMVKIPAAWMIEQCGWKGKRSGGAAVWDKQPLVIVNHTGEAYPEEIIGLEKRIIASVKAKFDIELHPEVEHI